MADVEYYLGCSVCSAHFARMVLIGPTETSDDLEAEVLRHALAVHGAGDRPPFARKWLNDRVRSTRGMR